MSESLFSSDCHLVSERRFVLRYNAQIARQANTDEVEYIVQNRFDGQHFRMSAAAYDIVGVSMALKPWIRFGAVRSSASATGCPPKKRSSICSPSL